jgi:hypothetical protein
MEPLSSSSLPDGFAYLSRLGRYVLCGPFLTKRADVAYLLNKLGTTHIVNLKPLSDRLTAKGHPADCWYQCYWKSKSAPLPSPVVWRYPLLGLGAKRREWVLWYTNTALRIAADLRANPNPNVLVYIHNETGLQEEAILAFTLCHVLEHGIVPDVDAWIAGQPHAQGVLYADEERVLLRECIAHLDSAKQTNQQGSLKGWVKVVKKRAKIE